MCRYFISFILVSSLLGFSNLGAQTEPDIRVLGNRQAFEELMRDDLARTYFYSLQDQIVLGIREAVQKIKNPADGSDGKSDAVNFVDIRPFEPLFDQLIVVDRDLNIVQELPVGTEIEEEDLKDMPPGLRVITRDVYLIERLEASFVDMAGEREPWMNDSLREWTDIVAQLKNWRMRISYGIEVDPGLERLELEIAPPGKLDHSRDYPYLQGRADRAEDELSGREITEGAVRVRATPRVKVLSFEGYFEDQASFHQYELPLFPEYMQEWLFEGVEAQVGVAVEVDLQDESPVDIRFDKLLTNLREVLDDQGRVVHPGIRVSDKDRDYFLRQLFVLGRFAFTLEELANPEGEDKKVIDSLPDEEKPLFQRVLSQVGKDVTRYLEKREIKLVVWAEYSEILEKTLIRVDVDSPERRLALENFEPAKNLLLVGSSSIPLQLGENGASLEYVSGELAFRITGDLPPRLETKWKIEQARLPSELTGSLDGRVGEILEGLEDENLGHEEMSLLLRVLIGQNQDSELVALEDVEILLPLNWKNEAGVWLNDEERARALERTRNFQNFDPENPEPWAWGEYGVPQIDTGRIEVNFHGLHEARVDDLHFQARSSVFPFVIDAENSDLEQQFIDQSPIVLEHLLEIIPEETLEKANQTVSEILREQVEKVEGDADTGSQTFSYSVQDFELEADAFSIDWQVDGEVVDELNLQPVDINELPENYLELYRSGELKTLTSRILLPESIRIRLDDVDDSSAFVEFAEFSVESSQEEYLEIEWSLVQDAAGELRMIPRATNFDDVFERLQVVDGKDRQGRDFRVGRVSPKTFIEGKAVGAVNAIGNAASAGGQAIDSASDAVADVMSVGQWRFAAPFVRTAGAVTGIGLNVGAQTEIVQPFKRSQIDPAVYSAISSALPMAKDVLRRNILRVAAEAVNGDVDGQDSQAAPLPLIQGRFREALEKFVSLAPIHEKLPEFENGGVSLVDRAESQVEGILVRSIEPGLNEEFVGPPEPGQSHDNPAGAQLPIPEEFTNSGFENEYIKLRTRMGEQLAQLPSDQAQAIEGQPKLEETANVAASEAANKPIMDAIQQPLEIGETDIFICLGREPVVPDDLVAIFGFANETEYPGLFVAVDPTPTVQENMRLLVEAEDFEDPFMVGLNLDFIVEKFIEPKIPEIEEQIVQKVKDVSPTWTNNTLKVDLQNTDIEVRRSWFYEDNRWQHRDQFVLKTELKVKQDTTVFNDRFLLFDVPFALATVFQINVNTGRNYLPIEIPLDLEINNASIGESETQYRGYELSVKTKMPPSEEGDRYLYIVDQRRGGTIATKIARDEIDSAIASLDIQVPITETTIEPPMQEGISQVVLGDPQPIYEIDGRGAAGVGVNLGRAFMPPEILEQQSIVINFGDQAERHEATIDWLLGENQGYRAYTRAFERFVEQEFFSKPNNEGSPFLEHRPQEGLFDARWPGIFMSEPSVFQDEETGQTYLRFQASVFETERAELREGAQRDWALNQRRPKMWVEVPVELYRFRQRSDADQKYPNTTQFAFGKPRFEKISGDAKYWEEMPSFEEMGGFRIPSVEEGYYGEIFDEQE